MGKDEQTSSGSEPRVVDFRRRAARTPVPGPPPIEDLAKYQQRRGDEPDDYRHRMVVNTLAFVFVVGLIGAGIWLADSMARMRKDQDCVLSGRRGCTPVEMTKQRW